MEDVRKAVREDTYRPFSQMMEMSHFLSVLDANTPRMPRIVWNDDLGETMVFDGHLITTTSFRIMYQKLLKDTRELLLNKVLLNLELPDLKHNHIYDELNNGDPGYSFISDKRNRYHYYGTFLIASILDAGKHGERFYYAAHTNSISGIAWNNAGVIDWMKTCETCISNLFALAHYGSGQPARGTELSTFAPENTKFHRRSVYWYKSFLNLVSMYNKTQTNTGKPRAIGRSLPPAVSELFVLWLALVVPTLHYIWNDWKFTPEDPERFHHRLFTGISGNFDTDDFSTILASLSGDRVVDFGMAHAMGMADTRHYLIGLMRQHCRGIPDRDFVEKYFNEQSGHGADAAENYAITFSSILNVSDDHLDKFVEISKLHHRLLFPETDVKSGPTSDSKAAIDYDKLSTLVVRKFESTTHWQLPSSHQLVPLASQLASLLAHPMKQNIADAFASIAPITPASVNVMQLLPGPVHHSEIHSESSSRVEPSLVDVTQVVVSPARWRELRELFGAHATFKSRYQAAALELSAQRKHDLLILLGTGGGKSLIFMLCAVNTDEAQLTTVVVVPFKALCEDLAFHLRAKNIRVAEWSQTLDHYTAQVIIVVSETAASDKFLAYFLKGCQEKKIARLVLDEIHTLLTDVHYRPLLAYMSKLRQANVQFIGLSATASSEAVRKIMIKMHFLPGNTLLIRAPTLRKEIAYSVFEMFDPSKSRDPAEALYRTVDGQSLKVVDYITQLIDKFRPKGRALIFCTTKKDAERLAAALHCDYYHAQVDNDKKASAIDLWRDGGKKVLVATTALSTGIHYDEIQLVVNYGKPRNLIEFGQESGRGGRELVLAQSTVFWDPSQKDQPLKPGQDDIGVAGMAEYVSACPCRRVCLGKHLDDDQSDTTCLQSGVVVLCDLCEKIVKEAAVVS